MPRTKPYTEIGISRVPCFRCGKSSRQQWQVCSLDNEYKGLCMDCDIKLNRIVLRFFQCSEWRKKAQTYANKLRREQDD